MFNSVVFWKLNFSINHKFICWVLVVLYCFEKKRNKCILNLVFPFLIMLFYLVQCHVIEVYRVFISFIVELGVSLLVIFSVFFLSLLRCSFLQNRTVLFSFFLTILELFPVFVTNHVFFFLFVFIWFLSIFPVKLL